MGFGLMEFLLLGLSAPLFAAVAIDLMIACWTQHPYYAYRLLRGWMLWAWLLRLRTMLGLTVMALLWGYWAHWWVFSFWWTLNAVLLLLRLIVLRRFIQRRARQISGYLFQEKEQ